MTETPADLMLVAYLCGQSMQEVADTMGVSRQRVSQLLMRTCPGVAALAAPAQRLRRRGWEVFDPSDPRWGRIATHREKHRRKRRAMITAIAAWKTTTGRNDPTVDELEMICGMTLPSIAHYWGLSRRMGAGRYTRPLARLRRVAGIVVRPIGNDGHLTHTTENNDG